ncbi:LysR family transcriptional regulator [Intestinirhabdus alba]|jgi:DNA-binding transcriptional LysR family regulator|uniref:LysR family transcriptional regulator n=1 Tax=Intestinirhabdus alba TaxID=2899544 RepID=A0A6L6IJ15_9ENTR|nr:LysR family transcriptional regulator [Intestinirhabdus alba]MTH46831.1 LysR family transcriptional regulator [Intestinirhabdus alba]
MNFFAAITTFVSAAELKSFSAAAKELNIETSTVSRHVALLEADLRVALFNRSTRGLSLTEAGKLFYSRATQLLAQWEETRSLTSALNKRPAGLLRLSAPRAFGRRHIMPFVEAFLQQNPDISLDISFCDEQVDLIESRQDLRIHIGPLPDSTMHARQLAPQYRYACATPAWAERHRETLKGDPAAANPDILMFSRLHGNGWYARTAGTDEEWQRYPASFRISSNDEDALHEACLQGAGIAILPDWLIADDLRTQRLQRVLPEREFSLHRAESAVWFVYPRKKIVASKVRSFIDFYVDRLGTPPWWQR